MADSTPSPLAKEVVKILKDARLEQGVSHETLAKQAGCHRTTIGQLEADKFHGTFELLVALSSALGLRFSEVVRLAEDRVTEADTE